MLMDQENVSRSGVNLNTSDWCDRTLQYALIWGQAVSTEEHNQFSNPKLLVSNVTEEAQEFIEAMAHMHKEAVDFIWTLSIAAQNSEAFAELDRRGSEPNKWVNLAMRLLKFFEVTVPDALVEEVARANFSKISESGYVVRNESGKIIKDVPWYVPADMPKALIKYLSD